MWGGCFVGVCVVDVAAIVVARLNMANSKNTRTLAHVNYQARTEQSRTERDGTG